MDTLGSELKVFRMRSGCDTITPSARVGLHRMSMSQYAADGSWAALRIRFTEGVFQFAGSRMCCLAAALAAENGKASLQGRSIMDTLGIEPRAFHMRSGCDTTTPCAP